MSPRSLMLTLVVMTGMVTSRMIQQSSVTSRAFLPTSTKPTSYDIKILPYLDHGSDKNMTFAGEVRVLFNVVDNTQEITLHSRGLVVTSAAVSIESSGETIGVSSWDYATDGSDFLTIHLEQQLTAGTKRLYLNMVYTGVMREELDGLFKSSYLDENNNTVWIAVTFLAATGARMVFPCWDEPSAKATFKLSVAHSPENIALSNMELGSQTSITDPGLEGWIWSEFMPTNMMSTYILSFSVCRHEALKSDRDPRFSLWARPEVVEQGKVANQLAPYVYDYLAYYVKHNLILGKMDQVAVPNFAYVAMENWGLIIFRETALLFEEGVSTTSDRELVELTVTHELAHQWFGDLVTPEWWDVVWLSEGFATFFEYFILSKIETTWQLEELFLLDQMHTVFEYDAYEETHALLKPNVITPEDANAVFDIIAYNKGSCILRLLQTLMGEEGFRDGLKEYLIQNMAKNANMDTLWKDMSSFVPANTLPADKSLKDVMDTWTLQSGYPVITLTRDYTSGSATIKQTRFMMSETPQNELWLVPVSMTSQRDPEVISWTWLLDQQKDITEVPADNKEWVLLNIKQTGYYRVNYDQENWLLLSEALHTNTRNIEVINRAQLMNDALALARANLLDYNTALNTTSYLHLETEYAPWTAALKSMSYLIDRLSYEQEGRSLIEWYMLDKMSNMYELVNGLMESDDDSHIMRLKRSIILSFACDLGHQKCNEDAVKLFQEWKTNDIQISPDMRYVVFCAGMRSGNFDNYNFLFNKYEGAKPSVQTDIIDGLGCATDPILLQQYLTVSITPNSVIKGRSVFNAVFSHPEGVDLALDFLVTSWQLAAEFYGGLSGVGTAFTDLASKLNNQEQQDKLKQLLESSSSTLGEALDGLEKAIKKVDENLAWQRNHRDEVVEFLTEVRGPSSAHVCLVSIPLLAFPTLYTLLTLLQ